MVSVSADLQIPREELRVTFARSSAPGGQNVNKVNSKAVLKWRVEGNPRLRDDVRMRFVARFGNRINTEGDVVLSCDSYRDQGRNVDACFEKLTRMLQSVLTPPKPRKPTRPTRSSVRRRLGEKRLAGEKKKQRKTRFDD